MFQKRCENHQFHENGGESLAMVQERNIAALTEILVENKKSEDTSIVIGTYGTALGTILNYYDRDYNYDSFLRIIDWMPYIIELDFEGKNLVIKQEHFHIEKEFKGKMRADKPEEKSMLERVATVRIGDVEIGGKFND